MAVVGSERTAPGRRLPIYLLLDYSGTMTGDSVEAAKQGVRALLADLREGAHAGVLWVSVIAVSSTIRHVLPLRELAGFSLPRWLDQLEPCGSCKVDESLKVLADRVRVETSHGAEANYQPVAFLFSDGRFHGCRQESLSQLKHRCGVRLIACATGSQADLKALAALSDEVVALAEVVQGRLGSFVQRIPASGSAAGGPMPPGPPGRIDTSMMP